MSDALGRRTISLGEVDAGGSRQLGRRSAVVLSETAVVVGTAAGDVRAYDRKNGTDRWHAWEADEGSSVVSLTPFAGGVAVGERGPLGEVRLHDLDTGDVTWCHETATDVGEPQRPSRFFLPFVVDLAVGGGRLYAAARRYERDGEDRSFTSSVYAFDPGGDVAWTYGTDASPIALDARGGRVAVAYNRCPGEHQHGLVVLDAGTGQVLWDWDPGTPGQRRVGDVSLLDDGLALACHGDYRGYRLGETGEERWRVDVGTPRTVDGETVYAYPNHVHGTDDGVVFVTGNTYPETGRETTALHPREHMIAGYTLDGERSWSASVGGFAHGIAVDGDHVAVPSAQHFRVRDPGVHGVRVFDVTSGRTVTRDTDGVATAAAFDGRTLAYVEEPVVYHDEGTEHGDYRLHVGAI